MSTDASIRSRIHCYITAYETSGYDVSPCLVAVVDTETRPCVHDVYELPVFIQFECEENTIQDLTDSDSIEEFKWDGDTRMAH